MQRCIGLVTKLGAQQSQARWLFVLHRILPLCCVLWKGLCVTPSSLQCSVADLPHLCPLSVPGTDFPQG